MVKHKPPWKALTATLLAVSMAFAPAAMADMDGYDISNWQCGIDTASVPADFVIVGTTWGSGGVYGGCLSNDGIADNTAKRTAQLVYDTYHSLGGNGHGTQVNQDIQDAPIALRKPQA